MLAGQFSEGCAACYTHEAVGFESMRLERNEFLSAYHARLELTEKDGALPRLSLPYVDIRFSNVCNLRCRSCDVTQSSAWASDTQALGRVVKSPVSRAYSDWARLWSELGPMLESGLEEILFAGGEPLMMEEHYRILEFLLAKGLDKVRLHYVTNFSTLRHDGHDLLELWNRFQNVEVTASLDASESRGEYLRKGSRWALILANREEMLRRAPRIRFYVAATMSVFNALHLPDLHRDLVARGFIATGDFVINPLLIPDYYSVQVLPKAFKDRMAKEYRSHVQEFLLPRGASGASYEAACRFAESQDRSDLLPSFLQMTRRLDGIRGERCQEVFPELAGLFPA